jgi:C4-type Zn-finger protein
MNIHGVLADATNDLTKADVRDMDELARHIASAGEKLETKLTSALADSERVRMLARQIDESGMAYEGTITTMEGQLGRAKEREDLLADQLRRRDLELEEIYNVSDKH